MFSFPDFFFSYLVFFFLFWRFLFFVFWFLLCCCMYMSMIILCYVCSRLILKHRREKEKRVFESCVFYMRGLLLKLFSGVLSGAYMGILWTFISKRETKRMFYNTVKTFLHLKLPRKYKKKKGEKNSLEYFKGLKILVWEKIKTLTLIKIHHNFVT